MSKIQASNNLYGFPQPISPSALVPIIAKRAPTTTDYANIGQTWIYTTSNLAYILTSIVSNSSTWLLLEASGGVGTFSSLTVTPGPISLTGTTTINTTGSAVTSIGTGGTGAVNIGNATGNTAVTGSLTASTSLTATLGNITATNGNVVLSTATNFLQLPGPVNIMSGAGAPSNGLALHVGDMYINTTAASATTRLSIATAASTWTNVTCAA